MHPATARRGRKYREPLMGGGVLPVVMLPTAALDMLKLDIADAEALAARGDVAGGHQVLAAGQHRAGGALAAGQLWGEALVHRYQAELDRYAAAHGYQP
jgi:hypothetical protein